MTDAKAPGILSPGRLTQAIRTRVRGRRGSTTASAPRVRLSREESRQLNERFALLGRAERRAILRAVNRGEAMPRRKDAALAIGVARRQQRFWSRAWLLGPGIALVQVLATPINWLEGLFLAAWGALLLGLMAAWWWTRARRAELMNLRVVGVGRVGTSLTAEDERPDAARRRGRLPGSEAFDEGDEDAPDHGSAVAPRPPRPRGRKRR
jgi:hypothetical protein